MNVREISYRTLLQSLCLALMISLTFVACSKKEYAEGDGEGTGVYDVTDDDIASGRADSDSGQAMGLQTVNFPFDSYELTSEARSKLESNAEILRNNPNLRIQIEGHCDERGGIQYNLALGEKRANAVKQRLVALGIDSSRIETISYGKERPIALGHTESAWAQNRRANFVITEK